MDAKSLIESKTFWANAIGPIFLFVMIRYGIDVDENVQNYIILGIMSLVNIGLRGFTHKPINSVLPQGDSL